MTFLLMLFAPVKICEGWGLQIVTYLYLFKLSKFYLLKCFWIIFIGFSLAAFKRNKRKLELAEKVETDLIHLKKRRQSHEKVSSCLKFYCTILNLQLINFMSYIQWDWCSVRSHFSMTTLIFRWHNDNLVQIKFLPCYLKITLSLCILFVL